MRRNAGLLYMTVIAIFLIIYLCFDMNVRVQYGKAGTAMKMAGLNMVAAEIKDDIARCDEAAAVTGAKAQISVKEIKKFAASADTQYKFGADALTRWNSVRDRIKLLGLLSAADTVQVAPETISAAGSALKDLQDLLSKAAEQNYNFDF